MSYTLSKKSAEIGLVEPGEGVCFLVNALSFGPVLVSFVVMKVAAREMSGGRRHALAELREGFVYAATTGPIRMILLIMAVGAFTAVSYVALMPLFAEEVFGRGATGLGMQCGIGCGSGGRGADACQPD